MLEPDDKPPNDEFLSQSKVYFAAITKGPQDYLQTTEIDHNLRDSRNSRKSTG